MKLQKPLNEFERKNHSITMHEEVFTNTWYGDIKFEDVIDKNDYVRFRIKKAAYEVKVDPKTRNIDVDTLVRIY